MGDWERELLGYISMLHDIGVFLSFNNHHLHSYYLIENSDLLGFDQTEIDIMANTTLFHRKGLPHTSRPEMATLDTHSQQTVRNLSVLLRMAEALDRSHAGIVKKVEFTNMTRKSVSLEIHADHECHLEVWGLHNEEKAFKKTFNRKLIIQEKII